MEKEKGFTLIELLIVVVIIGILVATGMPAYTRYVSSSRAAEASQMLTAVVSYCVSYHRAHLRWPPENCHTHDSTPNDWIDEIVGEDNVYFDYHYDQGGLEVRAHGKKDGSGPFAGEDELIYDLVTQQWSASGRLIDVLPD